MIAKHVPMTSAKKSDFAGLVKYLTGPQGKDERVGIVRTTNCHSEQAETAMLEVLNTQKQNTRAKGDKTYHLIVSFRAGEMPDEATLISIEERLCAGLGFADHQRVSIVHHDTDNLHVHIAINKIHPARYTMHEPFNAYHCLGQLCDALEDAYGLEKDNHKAQKVGSENRASDMERHAAVESLLGWIKRECKDQVGAAQSWEAMHQVMREHGLRIHERASGLVITSENGVSVKASSVDRNLSKAKLEARLGRFAMPAESIQNVKPKKRYDKQPMRSRFNTAELHAQYKAAHQLANTNSAAEWKKAVARKNRLIEDAKRTGRLKRAAIKLVHASAFGKKLMFAATSKTLGAEIASINRQYFKERQEIYDRYKRRTWADWLRSEATGGDQAALDALRARESATGLKGDTLGRRVGIKGRPTEARHDSITKKGTIIYRVGASALRDDGDKLKVSRGIDRAGLEVALRMAIDRYGSCISINGSASFKEQIAQVAVAANLSVSFDNDALERRRQQLAQAMTTKRSKNNDHSNDGGAVRRRRDRARDGVDRQGAAFARAAATAPTREGPRSTVGNKPNTGSAAQTPPAGDHNSVRGLPELGVVHVTNGGEVLLPGHVSRHVEHQRSKPDHGVRRGFRRPGLDADGREVIPGATAQAVKAAPIGKPNLGRVGTVPPPASKDRLRQLSQLEGIGIGKRLSRPLATHSGLVKLAGRAAADKYISERAQKKAKGLNVPTHVRYAPVNRGTAAYAGIRQIDGQSLALLEHGNEIMVLPVDDATARRLKRVAIGHQVGLTVEGVIKIKGRTI